MNKKEGASKSDSLEKILVKNFVDLQEVMTNLSENFTKLSSQISKLLGLFEQSAKTLAEKGIEDNREIIKKLTELSEQNKILAQGIALLHESEEEEEQTPQQPPQMPRPVEQKPLLQIPTTPRYQMPIQKTPQSMNAMQPAQTNQQTSMQQEGYQKSISTNKGEI